MIRKGLGHDLSMKRSNIVSTRSRSVAKSVKAWKPFTSSVIFRFHRWLLWLFRVSRFTSLDGRNGSVSVTLRGFATAIRNLVSPWWIFIFQVAPGRMWVCVRLLKCYLGLVVCRNSLVSFQLSSLNRITVLFFSLGTSFVPTCRGWLVILSSALLFSSTRSAFPFQLVTIQTLCVLVPLACRKWAVEISLPQKGRISCKKSSIVSLLCRAAVNGVPLLLSHTSSATCAFPSMHVVNEGPAASSFLLPEHNWELPMMRYRPWHTDGVDGLGQSTSRQQRKKIVLKKPTIFLVLIFKILFWLRFFCIFFPNR